MTKSNPAAIPELPQIALPDTKYCDFIYKMLAKHVPKHQEKEILRLPVFRFTKKEMEQFDEDDWEESLKQLRNNTHMLILPFDKFVVVLDTAFIIFDFSRIIGEQRGIHVTQFPRKPDMKTAGITDQEYLALHAFFTKFGIEKRAKDGFPLVHANVSVSRYLRRAEQITDITDDLEAHETPRRQVINLGRIALELICLFSKADAQHLVSVTRKRDVRVHGHRSRHQWRATLPRTHYIYLDAPPSFTQTDKSDKKQEGQPLIAGHKRRAHWRTLRDPRFRKHPHYGRRIRIRATWVGPTTWKDSHAVYTVMNTDSDI